MIRPSWRLASLALALGLSLGWASLSWTRAAPPRTLAALAPLAPSVTLEGRILAGPSPAFAADGAERRRLDLWVVRVGPPPGRVGPWIEARGGVRVTLDDPPLGLAVGDTVRLWASLSPLPGPQNPHETDSRERLRGQGLDAVAYGRAITARAAPPPGWLDAARAKAARALVAATQGEERAVLGALLLGEPGSLPPELRARFAATGTSHVLAVSGGHVVAVTFLVSALLQALLVRCAWLGRRIIPGRAAAAACIPVVILYVAFVGASPSALRAGIASVLALTARALGRRIAPPDLIALAALVSLCLEPEELFGPSLQLSFGAVIGLVVLSPPLRACWPIKRWGALGWTLKASRELLVATLAATLATLPITAWHFRQIALASLWANFALVPLVSLCLLPLGLLGVLCALLGLPWDGPLFRLCAWCWQQLGALLAWLSPARPTDLALSSLGLLSFVLLVAALRWLRGVRRLGAVVLLLVSWASLSLFPTAPRLRITFLSVGQGDGIVLELPNGEIAVIDGGGASSGHDDPGARVMLPFLRSIGARQIDWMFLSHPHPDHFGGLATVAEQLPVVHFWHNGGHSPDPRFLRLLAANQGHTDAPRDGAAPYAAFPRELGGVTIEPLGPWREGQARPFEDENDNSLVFRLRYGARSILFTGDAEAIAEEAMLDAGLTLRADILKVGHHGSRSSSTDEFLEAVQPRAAIVSLGLRNQFGFPHQEVTARYQAHEIPLWRTDQGAVVVETDGDSVWVYRPGPRSFLGELWPAQERGAPLVVGDAP